MNSTREGEISGGGETGGGGKEIDRNEEGNLDSSKQQTNVNVEIDIKPKESSEMSDPELSKKDQISEDSRNPTFVFIEQNKTLKKVNLLHVISCYLFILSIVLRISFRKLNEIIYTSVINI